MIKKEEFEKILNNLRDKLDDTTSALVSEDILSTISAYNNAYDENVESNEKINALSKDKEELLKVNGRLYQKIGFDKEETKDDTKEKDTKEELKIEDVINEKGELI